MAGPSSYLRCFSRMTDSGPGKGEEPSGEQREAKRLKTDTAPTKGQGSSAATTLRLVSWNVDGLEPSQLEERANAACDELLREEHDVILLQEVVADTAAIFLSRLCTSGYESAPEGTPLVAPYFTMAFVRSALLTVQSATRTPFTGSTMGRDLVEVVVRHAGCPQPLLLMTSHLESLGARPNSRQRCAQLTAVVSKLTMHQGPAVFAGDTNLRDKEVAQHLTVRQVKDAWEAAGCPADGRYTWDLLINDNKRMPGGTPRCRFDRVYLNPALASGGVSRWRLLGKGRIGARGPFPSDHFGIACDLQLPQ